MLRLSIARNEAEIGEACELRYQVYAEEERMLQGAARAQEHDGETCDYAETTRHFLVYSGQAAVGTVRLSVEEPGRELALESKFTLSGLRRPGATLAEVTRFCVLRRFRGGPAAGLLFAALRRESLRLGVSHWLAAANTETDAHEDAALAYRVLEAKGWLSDRFAATPRAPAAAPTTPRRFLYTPAERQRARQGELTELAAPRILSLFARKMGARFIGPPAYDERFEVFAMPLAVDLAQLSCPPARLPTSRAVGAVAG